MASLDNLVAIIGRETGSLLEIVNHNVEVQQYVCAGTLQTLDILTQAANALASQSLDSAALPTLVRDYITKNAGRTEPITLTRGKATIPIAGIDVPFHSSFLLPNLPAFREVLLQNIKQEAIDPRKLIGKYVPNVTARPFDISKESFEKVYEITKSERLKEVLDNWDSRYAGTA